MTDSPTKPKLPGLAITIAVLNMVFGFPCLGASIYGAIDTALTSSKVPAQKVKAPDNAPPPPIVTKTEAEIDDEMNDMLRKGCPGYFPVMIASNAIHSIIGLLFCVAGIALLMGKPLGRSLTIGLCYISILVTILSTIYAAIFVMPVQKEFFAMNRAFMPPGFADAMFVAMYGMILAAVVFEIGYCVFALFCMSTAKVKAYYSGRTDNTNVDQAYNNRLGEDQDNRWES